MESVAANEFLTWIHRRGLKAQPSGYPEGYSLRIDAARRFSHFWTFPRDPIGLPAFFARILTALDPWSFGFLWPTTGFWPAAAQPEWWGFGVCDIVLKAAGIPNGWTGAMRFERDELSAVVAVGFVHLLFQLDDVLVVPDHARQIVRTDHHDVVHVYFADESRVASFVECMAEAGYELPTELPDETFIRPDWMAE